MIGAILCIYTEEEFLVADGFDKAIIGVDEASMRLVYSVRKCVQLLKAKGMSHEEALDYFAFNVQGSYVGEKTPIWCQDMF